MSRLEISMIWTFLRVHHFGKRFGDAITSSEMINVIALKTIKIALLPAPLNFWKDAYLLLPKNRSNQTIRGGASTLIKIHEVIGKRALISFRSFCL